MKESRQLEFKSEISNTFLKTVSAFANYDGGQIIFGIADSGTVVGLADPKQACLDIENKINDTIRPQPWYQLTVQETDRTVMTSYSIVIWVCYSHYLFLDFWDICGDS